MNVQRFVVGAFEENSWLLVDEHAAVAVLVDPGADGDTLLAAVDRSGATLEAIWLTHAHVDHIGAIAAVRRRHAVPIFLHPDDRPVYDLGARIAEMYGLPFESPPPPDRALADGDELTAGTLRFRVMHAPGHAPGHVVIHGEGIAFTGDCLFAGTIGRTDLPLANGEQLAVSLDRIMTLDDATIVYPGHGASTTIGEERLGNPFLNGSARVRGG